MAPKNKALTVYPDETARMIVGGNSPACNRAIEGWAMVLRWSMPKLDRSEWNFLADVLKSSFDCDVSMRMYEHGAAALALAVHDAQTLNGTGDKWFGDPANRGTGQMATNALRAKIGAMKWEELQYIRTAASFFWSEAADRKIDHTKDEWWTLSFRFCLLREIE